MSEQLDIVPQQIRVIQHPRVKYACPCCDGGTKVTPAPACIIAKGLLTGMLTCVIEVELIPE
ncbi:IS66 family transposase zinc-finger binding domain-containing protein [Pseudomonas sp. NPDC098747]|uniref:IS66 family transposase zinc-finger binding domain-containing protein n=1 Tax=Pseudomonas sp. NPDC098747 TaxID=3364487 RepID=UPI003839F0CE